MSHVMHIDAPPSPSLYMDRFKHSYDDILDSPVRLWT